jgi:hypothetical protein
MKSASGKMPTSRPSGGGSLTVVGPLLDSVDQRSNGLMPVELGPGAARGTEAGAQIVRSVVHERSIRPSGPQLLGDLLPGVAGGGTVGLDHQLVDRRPDRRVTALQHVDTSKNLADECWT